MSKKYDVIIVGGGMGGLALAWALGRQGRSVALIERQRELKPLIRGELLQPNGLRALDQLGLLEDLKTLPSHTAYQFHFLRIGQGRLLTVDYRMLPPPWNYTLILPPHFLLNQILQKIEKTGHVSVFTETEFQEILFENNSIKGIRAHQHGKSIELYGTFIVGSDGARSKVRSALGIKAKVRSYSEAYLTMIVRRPEGFNQEARYYVGKKEILGLFPISDSALYLFYMIPADGPERSRRGSIKDIVSRVIQIDAALEGSLHAVSSWDQVGYMPCVRVQANRWTAKGAVLMGDAAHAMNPHVAQGRNQALEDAVCLATIFEEAYRTGNFSNRMFESYERNRRPIVEALQKQGDETVLLWNTGFPPLMWLRDRSFRRLDRNDRLRYKVLSLISGQSDSGFSLMDRWIAAGIYPFIYNT